MRRDYTLKFVSLIFVVMKLTKTKFIDRPMSGHIVELERKHLEDRQTVLN